MAELGKITPAEAAEAKATKLGYKGTKLPGGCESSPYPYFCIYVRNEILKQPRASARRPKARLSSSSTAAA